MYNAFPVFIRQILPNTTSVFGHKREILSRNAMYIDVLNYRLSFLTTLTYYFSLAGFFMKFVKNV